MIRGFTVSRSCVRIGPCDILAAIGKGIMGRSQRGLLYFYHGLLARMIHEGFTPSGRTLMDHPG